MGVSRTAAKRALGNAILVFGAASSDQIRSGAEGKALGQRLSFLMQGGNLLKQGFYPRQQ